LNPVITSGIIDDRYLYEPENLFLPIPTVRSRCFVSAITPMMSRGYNLGIKPLYRNRE
jgi:hypothetical protein